MKENLLKSLELKVVIARLNKMRVSYFALRVNLNQGLKKI